jgi:hypothetical protein
MSDQGGPQQDADAARLRAALTGALAGPAAWLARPRVRSVLVGLVLIVLGLTALSDSVWTLPVLIIGVLMIVVAWVGSRLEGRFVVEWSDRGAGFEMRARFKSASILAHPSLARHSVNAGMSAESPGPSTIEGHAHTVEIDSEALRALVRAAERSMDPAPASTTSSTPTDGLAVEWQKQGATGNGGPAVEWPQEAPGNDRQGDAPGHDR